MQRAAWILTALAAVAGTTLAGVRDAKACGGCFGPTQSPSVVTDHRMILSISSQQTTLYDQIKYSGNPSSFAWVLPISGQATVGLSADVVFDVLDGMTKTTITAPPPPMCGGPPASNCGERGGAAVDGGASFAADSSAPPPVTVTKEETVGPYETVQLHSSDPNALNTWLTSHGFAIPDDVKPVIAAYVNEHFDFLAMKLVPGASVSAMRPVRITTAGASPVLPLRMVAAGTGATVGITLWVLGEGRYETQNFPSFTISADELVWDYATSSSNYVALRQQKEDALGGRGWQIESSIGLAAYDVRQRVVSGGSPYGGPVDAGSDYEGLPAVDGGSGDTPDQVRNEDMQALFAGLPPIVRVTRIRSDLAHAALANDLVLQASQSQAELPNQLRVTRTQNVPTCPVYPDPPPCPNDSPFGPNGTNGDTPPSKETFSCAAAPNEMASPEALGALIALFGVIGARARRRR